MKQTAALIVFEPGINPEQAKQMLANAIKSGKEDYDGYGRVKVERIQTQSFDPELGPVVIYQP